MLPTVLKGCNHHQLERERETEREREREIGKGKEDERYSSTLGLQSS